MFWAVPSHQINVKIADSCNPVHLKICVLTFLPGELKEPYNRFICTINKSFPRLKRDRGRKETKKRPLIQWSMRWFYLTSKTSRAVQAEFWLSFCSFSGWSKARDVPQSILEAYPCCCKQRIQTILLSLSLAQHVNGYFSRFSTFSPFPLPFWHSFLLVALFCTQCPVVLK